MTPACKIIRASTEDNAFNVVIDIMLRMLEKANEVQGRIIVYITMLCSAIDGPTLSYSTSDVRKSQLNISILRCKNNCIIRSA